MKAEVTLTNDDILALKTTPFTIVAAPGVGKAIMPIKLYLEVHIADGAYGGGSEAAFDCQAGYGQNVTDATNDIPLNMTLAANSVYIFQPIMNFTNGDWQFLDSSIENKELTLCSDAPNALTGGNAANYMKATLIYEIINL